MDKIKAKVTEALAGLGKAVHAGSDVKLGISTVVIIALMVLILIG